MKLLEYQSKRLLAEFGIAVNAQLVARSTTEAVKAAAELKAPVVIKVQIPKGKRGKTGGVLFATELNEVEQLAERLLAMEIAGHKVTSVTIEPQVAYEAEYYAGITWDGGARLPVAILSTAGGMDVESANPECVVRRTFDPRIGLPSYIGREMARTLELTGGIVASIGQLLSSVAKAFLATDAVMLEINPFVATANGSLVALDARIEIDDDAAVRQGALLAKIGGGEANGRERTRSSLELEADKIDAKDHRGVSGRVVEFDGDLALLIGGGGASLTVFDAIRRYGGRPANYCEVGGNPTEEKVAALTELLVSRRAVRKLAVIMNVVNNTRADVMARGVIAGVRRAGRNPADTICVFRIPGSWEQEAKQLLAEEKVDTLGREISLNEAARLAVEKMQNVA